MHPPFRAFVFIPQQTLNRLRITFGESPVPYRTSFLVTIGICVVLALGASIAYYAIVFISIDCDMEAIKETMLIPTAVDAISAMTILFLFLWKLRQVIVYAIDCSAPDWKSSLRVSFSGPFFALSHTGTVQCGGS